LARRGRAVRLDYSASKGAITVFTHSLSQALAEEGIRVNGVAPGPIWAPLIPSTFPAKDVETLAPMFHPVVPGQPEEVTLSHVLLTAARA
jgi:NAD(P)-dependent dehydrogenase (short-subunit alcohol dehydrogenase family)